MKDGVYLLDSPNIQLGVASDCNQIANRYNEIITDVKASIVKQSKQTKETYILLSKPSDASRALMVMQETIIQ